MINPFYLFPLHGINATSLIPQPAQWKCRHWKKFTLQVWMCDAVGSIFLARGGCDLLGSQTPSSQVTQRLWGDCGHGGFGFVSPPPCRLYPCDPSSQWPGTDAIWPQKASQGGKVFLQAAPLNFGTCVDIGAATHVIHKADKSILAHIRLRYIHKTSGLALLHHSECCRQHHTNRDQDEARPRIWIAKKNIFIN